MIYVLAYLGCMLFVGAFIYRGSCVRDHETALRDEQNGAATFGSAE